MLENLKSNLRASWNVWLHRRRPEMQAPARLEALLAGDRDLYIPFFPLLPGRQAKAGLAFLADPRWFEPDLEKPADKLNKLIELFGHPQPQGLADVLQPFVEHPNGACRIIALETILQTADDEAVEALLRRGLTAGDADEGEHVSPTVLGEAAQRAVIPRRSRTSPGLPEGRPNQIERLMLKLFPRVEDMKVLKGMVEKLATEHADETLRLVLERWTPNEATEPTAELLDALDQHRRRPLENPAAARDRLTPLYRAAMAAAGSDASARKTAVRRLLHLAAAAGLPEAEEETRRLFENPLEPPPEVALDAARALAGIGGRAVRLPEGLEPKRSEPGPAHDPIDPAHLLWVERRVKEIQGRVMFDGWGSIYGELRVGEAEAIHQAFDEVDDPLMEEITREAVAMVREHGIHYEQAPGVMGVASEAMKAFEAKWWDPVFKRSDPDARTRADLHMLRHADHLGGRLLAWLPDALPGERPAAAQPDAGTYDA